MIATTPARKDIDPKLVIGVLGIAAVAVMANYARISGGTAAPPPRSARVDQTPATPTQAQLVRSGVTRPSQLIAMVRSAVDPNLRDPESARYSGVAAYSPPEARGKVLFCGKVNARNGFGGYTGSRKFIVVPGFSAVFQGRSGFATTFADVCRPGYLVADVVGL